MDNPVHVVDENAGGRNLFQNATVQRRFAKSDARAYVPRNGSGVVADGDRSEPAWQEARPVAYLRHRLVDAGSAVGGAEQSGRAVGGFGCAKNKKAAGIERIVKGVAHLLLQVSIKIDEDIAAGDQGDMGERRNF